MHTTLRNLGYISDPGSDNFELMPGEAYSGTVALSGKIKNIDEAVRKHGVTLQWAYQLRARSGYVLRPVSGEVVIEQSQKSALPEKVRAH